MSKKLTNSSGIPYFEHQDSQTVGARGPVLLQDFILQENLAHFVRERIPERIVQLLEISAMSNVAECTAHTSIKSLLGSA